MIAALPPLPLGEGWGEGALLAREPSATYLAELAPAVVRGFDLLATAPNGIARLRAFLVTLAVRGLLVRQTATDEPAVELVRRIATAGGRLLPTLITDGLPEGWSRIAFGDYATELNTGPFGSLIGKGDYVDGGVPLVNPSHMRDGRIQAETKVSVSEGKAVELSSYRLRLGDIVFARRGEVGRTALVTEAEHGWLCGTGSFFARFHADVDREYIQMVFASPAMRAYLGGEAVGSTMVNLNQRALRSAAIDLPPLAEQHRIVARVEELMKLCDALEQSGRLADEQHARLTSTLFDALAASESAHALAENWQRVAEHFDLLLDRPEAIDALEQAILQLAVSGLLVPQDVGDESAIELLDRIRLERDRLISEGQIGKGKPAPVLGDDALPCAVPHSWVWAPFGAVVHASEAGWSPNCEGGQRTGTSWGVLKVSAVSWGEFRSRENKELPRHLEARAEFEVRDGDFLISRANTAELVARSVVVSHPEPRLMMSDKIIRLRLSSLVDRQFFNLVNNSRLAREYYAANASGTSSSMKNVGRDVILGMPVPVPPLAQQHRIVARVEELRRLCAELREHLTEARRTQSQLADALVAQATT